MLVVIFLLTYVIPQVVQVFAQTRQALPLITQVMIGLSAFLRSYGWLLVLAAVGAAFAIGRALRVPRLRLQWHRRILQLPVIGALARALNTARFASTLAILVGSGVPMLRALQAAGDTVTNLALRERVVDAAQRVREGASLARSLQFEEDDRVTAGRLRLFPPVLIHLIRSGETTGKLPEMLARAADMHAREAERRAMLLTSLLEPALILTMGLVVMMIVLAVLMPIIEINQLAR
jgi:general secretion pathway protein F